MKAVFFGMYFIVSVGLLMLTFSITGYLSNTTLSKTSTVLSYFILALLLTIAAYLATWISRLLFPKLREGGWADVTATAGVIFLLLCLLSAIFGPFGVDIPGTRIRGIFFAEFKFLNFIVYDGILLALFGGIVRRFVKY
jgi:hypothetical protein